LRIAARRSRASGTYFGSPEYFVITESNAASAPARSPRKKRFIPTRYWTRPASGSFARSFRKSAKIFVALSESSLLAGVERCNTIFVRAAPYHPIPASTRASGTRGESGNCFTKASKARAASSCFVCFFRANAASIAAGRGIRGGRGAGVSAWGGLCAVRERAARAGSLREDGDEGGERVDARFEVYQAAREPVRAERAA
jgi:hypothetical protein